MRRLERRMRPEGDAPAPIQYIAASATLSDSDDQNEKINVAEKFASGIFPADRNSFHIEFGESAQADTANANPIPRNLQDFRDRNKELYERTIAYENRKTTHKQKTDAIAVLKYLKEHDRTARAIQIRNISSCFEGENPACQIPPETPCEIEVNDSIRWMAKFVIECRGIGLDSWRELLHDHSRKNRSCIDGDTIPNTNIQKPFGNRLDILQVWENIQEGQQITSVTYPVFAYLYQAALKFAQENPPWGLDIPNLPITVTEDVQVRFNAEIDNFDSIEGDLKNEKKALDDEWKESLPDKSDELSYSERLYRAVCDHEQIRDLKDLLAKRPESFEDLAAAMDVTPENLQKIFEISALAVHDGRRQPLIDPRYHQVVRDIREIGIYFEDGDIDKPRFVRNTEEFSATGEKIFTLGLCRNCGQPYLLGFMNFWNFGADLTGNNPYLFRAESGDVKYMHAFAWREHVENTFIIPDDGYPKEAEDADVWLNLRTGEVCRRDRANQPGWKKMYWVLNSNNENYANVGNCKYCGKNNSHDVKYGIVTPYEAVGTQYKISVLDAFAVMANPDPDETVRETAAAEGRKVLAFSDSRSKASQLAHIFESTKERR